MQKETAEDLEDGYLSVPFDEQRVLIFSKDTDNLPLTSVKLEYEPCMN